jgi:hypothetical protein
MDPSVSTGCGVAAAHVGVLGGDLLDRLATADRLHGDPGLEPGTMRAALTQIHLRRLRLRWTPQIRDGTTPQRVVIGLPREARSHQQSTRVNTHQQAMLIDKISPEKRIPEAKAAFTQLTKLTVFSLII